jgi:hypothetical protein
MKIQKPNRFARRENGMATIFFIALLAIMIMLVAANLRALAHLHREVKLLEQQQVQRLNSAENNSVSVTVVPPK